MVCERRGGQIKASFAFDLVLVTVPCDAAAATVWLAGHVTAKRRDGGHVTCGVAVWLHGGGGGARVSDVRMTRAVGPSATDLSAIRSAAV